LSAMEIGRICVKLLGREAGKKCVIVDAVDKNFVIVTGPKQLTGVKRRKANAKHLEFTNERIEVKKGASDDEVMKIIDRSKKKDFMKSEVKPKTV